MQLGRWTTDERRDQQELVGARSPRASTPRLDERRRYLRRSRSSRPRPAGSSAARRHPLQRRHRAPCPVRARARPGRRASPVPRERRRSWRRPARAPRSDRAGGQHPRSEGRPRGAAGGDGAPGARHADRRPRSPQAPGPPVVAIPRPPIGPCAVGSTPHVQVVPRRRR